MSAPPASCYHQPPSAPPYQAEAPPYSPQEKYPQGYGAAPPPYFPGPYSGAQQHPGTGYPQLLPSYQGTNVVVQPRSVIVHEVVFREDPVTTVCKHCQATVSTSTRTQVGLFVWIMCAFLFIIGCWIGCCFIPFCISGLHDVTHSCPNCEKVIHVQRKL